jgi:hypothetical protein
MVFAKSDYPMHITRTAMRPDHTTAHYAPPGEAFPLTRVTFCFAGLFGLEPFLAGGTITQSRSGPGDRP